MSDLRKRVARAMAAKDSGPEGSKLFDIHWREFSTGYLSSADAAIAIVLEEAARVAETCHVGWPMDGGEQRNVCARAIRALVKHD